MCTIYKRWQGCPQYESESSSLSISAVLTGGLVLWGAISVLVDSEKVSSFRPTDGGDPMDTLRSLSMSRAMTRHYSTCPNPLSSPHWKTCYRPCPAKECLAISIGVGGEGEYVMERALPPQCHVHLFGRGYSWTSKQPQVGASWHSVDISHERHGGSKV